MSKACLALTFVVVAGGLALGQASPPADEYLEVGLREAQRCRQRAQHDQAIPIYSIGNSSTQAWTSRIASAST
jgi:hypothetical protein